MQKIFSYLNQLAPFPRACLRNVLLLCFSILLPLIYLRFHLFLSSTFLFIARYAICVSAAVFSEALIFSCVINNKTQTENK